MANKTFQTRVQNKFDDIQAWSSASAFVPLKGELCVVQVPVEQTAVQGDTARPQYLFKVGDGTSTFSVLPFVSAPAADVYAWCKENKIHVQKDGVGNVVSGIEWDASLNDGKGGLKFTTASVATSEGLEALQQQVANKADKVSGATNGNFAGLDASGNLVDSGKKSSDFDVAGAAAAVQGGTSSTVKNVEDSVTAIKNGSTINNFSGVETALTKKQDNLVFNTEYNSSSNKAATMTDVNTAKTEANNYTDTQISGLNIGQYATTDSVNSAIGAAKTELIGTGTASSNTIKSAVDEAKAYADQKIAAQISSVYTPSGSVAFESLPTLEAANKGRMFNITNSFTTTEDFVEGAGTQYPAGTNVACVDIGEGVYRWDAMSGVQDMSAYDTAEVAQGKIDAAKQAAIEAAALDATSKANTAETNAKQYADELKTTIDGTVSTVSTRVDNLETKVGSTSVAQQITAAIGALDVSDEAVAGQFVTSVSETDGKIVVKRAAVKLEELQQTDYIIFNCGSSTINI